MISGTGVLLAFVGFALLGVAAAIVWWINRTPSAYRRSAQSELPLFSVSLTESRYSPVKPQPIIPAARSSNGKAEKREASRMANAKEAANAVTPASAAVAQPASPSSAPSMATAAPPLASSAPPSTRTPSGQRPSVASASNATAPAPARPMSATAPLVPEASTAVIEDGVPGTQVEGHLLRFAVPQEGTLQFLPGRLEILNGLDAGREVRFVRAPGPEGLQVTFGRAEGPAYRHVQLREGTVSRSHARMALRDGAWHLTNLSSTNPVVHNEQVLTPGEERQLADGDRVEMGEVVFGFHSR